MNKHELEIKSLKYDRSDLLKAIENLVWDHEHIETDEHIAAHWNEAKRIISVIQMKQRIEDQKAL